MSYKIVKSLCELEADAYFARGLSYEKGYGVEVDMKEANEWDKLAAEAGHVGAQSAYYEKGTGFEVDVSEATSPLNEAMYEDETDDDYLPTCHHLFPEEYNSFLMRWRKEVDDNIGSWFGSQKEYMELYPEKHAEFIAENKRLLVVYRAEIAVVNSIENMLL